MFDFGVHESSSLLTGRVDEELENLYSTWELLGAEALCLSWAHFDGVFVCVCVRLKIQQVEKTGEINVSHAWDILLLSHRFIDLVFFPRRPLES